MNDYITAQIMQMKAYCRNCEAACQMAATKDDGKIDREEEKALKRIHKAVEDFTRELDRAL